MQENHLNYEQQATELVDYYQRLATLDSEGLWQTGLFMAKFWLDLVTTAEPSKEMATLFVSALEHERVHQGSGWTDLWLKARNWLQHQFPVDMSQGDS